jgi:ubiquinone/menaquinone biosynthesis C-methylase UbiE
MTAQEGGPETVFDAQAASFEKRAGLLPVVSVAIASTLIDICALDAKRSVLDLGAGSGDVGLDLVARGIGYTGLDRSEGMLAVFRSRAAAVGLVPELVAGDAGLAWPVRPGSTCLVFGSRSLHWLDPEHVAAEAFRVASQDGAHLLIGRVQRDDDSPKRRARHAMRQLLGREGIAGRSGSRNARAVVEACLARGAKPFAPRVVATWQAHGSIRDAIDSWHDKPGLAGVSPSNETKDRVLRELARFTSQTFGNIDAMVESTERYVLEGATLIDARR